MSEEDPERDRATRCLWLLVYFWCGRLKLSRERETMPVRDLQRERERGRERGREREREREGERP